MKILLLALLVSCATEPEYKRDGHHVDGIEDCCWEWFWWGDYAVEQCMVEVLEIAVDNGQAMPGQCQRLECGFPLGHFDACEGN